MAGFPEMRALALLVGFCAIPRAEATKCGPAQPTLVPSHGADVPPDPTFYLFTPRSSRAPTIEATEDADPATFEVAIVTETDAFDVRRIRVEASGGMVSVVVDGEQSHYEVDPSYTSRLPRRGPVHVVSAEHRANRRTDAWFLRPSVEAPVYRLEWAKSEADYRAGRRHTAIVPVDARGEVGLGQLACQGETFPSTSLPAYVGLAGVFLDGTVVPAADDPVVVGRARAVPSFRRFAWIYGPLLLLVGLTLALSLRRL